MKKKQITALLLSVFLIFGCSACAGNTNESSASSETSVSSAEPTPTEEPDVVPEDGVYTAGERSLRGHGYADSRKRRDDVPRQLAF